MKTFLLQTKEAHCETCGMATLLVMHAESEGEARLLASRSNTHGKAITGIDWLDATWTTCDEFPVDGPKGILVGSWFDLERKN